MCSGATYPKVRASLRHKGFDLCLMKCKPQVWQNETAQSKFSSATLKSEPYYITCAEVYHTFVPGIPKKVVAFMVLLRAINRSLSV